MAEFTLTSTIDLATGLEDVFAFFQDASNLQRLTPPWVDFAIVSALPIEMKVGALIDYRIRVRGFWMNWRTRISDWEPNRRFVDEQLRGPYKQWIHEHRFEAIEGGTRMTDFVRYVLPFGILGALFAPIVIRDIERIFAYRRDEVVRIFGSIR